jgi:hypothetical protein
VVRILNADFNDKNIKLTEKKKMRQNKWLKENNIIYIS